MKELLFAHFSGRSTALQRTTIADWLQHPENQLLYVAWLDEWERQHLQYMAEEETAFELLNERIDAWNQQKNIEETEEKSELPVRRRFVFVQWLAAASVVLLLVAGMYAGRNYIFYQTIETAFGETRQLTLPDGSQVSLNAHSSLRFPRFGFGPRSRVVWLTGEAAFSVQQPLRIDAVRQSLAQCQQPSVLPVGGEIGRAHV